MPKENVRGMSRKPTIGWREWVALPELGLERIKAKVDTGARTSCLHAFNLEPFDQGGERWVRFGMHPRQHSDAESIECTAPVLEERVVTDSGGHRENRMVIRSLVQLYGQSWDIELTLTGRDDMRFRMLLGRTAIRRRFVVDPGRSFLAGDTGNDRENDEDEQAEEI